MSHTKNFRYVVGMLGFLSIGLYLVLATFGVFSVSEVELTSEYSEICGGLVYIGALFFAAYNNMNLTSDKPTDETEMASFGIVFYVLFFAVEWLSFGSPTRGVMHGVLPVLGLLIPAAIVLITKK